MDHIVENVSFGVTTGKKIYEIRLDIQAAQWSRLLPTGNWRGQAKKYWEKEMRNLESANPFTLKKARLVCTVLKETSLVCTSQFPVT